jgi:hypothetical protein
MNELLGQKKSVIKKYMQGNTAVVDSRWHRKIQDGHQVHGSDASCNSLQGYDACIQ